MPPGRLSKDHRFHGQAYNHLQERQPRISFGHPHNFLILEFLPCRRAFNTRGYLRE